MHPLYGPRAKIERAKSQIVALQQSVQGFFRDNFYEIGVAEYNPKPDNYSLRVKSGPEEFPVDWSLSVGEIAHNLRSALDGLTWQLALLGPNPPFRHTSFPICLDKSASRKIGDRTYPAFDSCKKIGRGCLQSVPHRFLAPIEGFQPYKRGNGGRHSSLVFLNELNNTDKHRLVTVLTTTPARWEFTGLSGGTHFRRRAVLKRNAKIGWVRDVPPNKPGEGGIYILDPVTMNLLEPEMQVDVKIAPSVLFGDSCQAVKRLPVVLTLRRMVDEVSCVVESFSGEFPR